MKAVTLFMLLVLMLLTACSDSSEEREQTHTAQIFVFGTLVDITLWDVDETLRAEAISLITRDFQTMHHDWHPWNPGPLVDINSALSAGEAGQLPDSMIPLIQGSTELYRQTDGLFNPTIGGLLRLWGFQSSNRPHGPPPDAALIAEWVAQAPDMDDLSLDGNRLYSSNPATQLDFGAYAKGYAVDVAIQRLQDLGIRNAIVNAGGDLRAIGSKGNNAWRVGIQHPQGERDKLFAWLDVSDGEAVFTSGNYERYREDLGIRYSHILDPRTGMPVDRVTSVTVIHPDNGAIADAVATALVVAGPDEWSRIARQTGIDQVLLVDDAGTVYMTPAMQQRIHFQQQPHSLQIVQP